jgi:hypothetical protein
MLRETGRWLFQVLRGAVIAALVIAGTYATIRCARAGFGGGLFAHGCYLAPGLTRSGTELAVRAIERFIDDRGRCPRNAGELPAGSDLPRRFEDAWGRAYFYECWSDDLQYAVSVRSAGRDGQLGTDDDIAASDLYARPEGPPLPDPP